MAANTLRNTKHQKFIVAITLLSLCAFILTIFAMASEHWLEATAVLTERLQSHVNYGLFRGSIERQQLASTLKFTLTLVCDFGVNVCMYSCQQDSDRRQIELKRVIRGQDLDPCEQSRYYQPKLHRHPQANLTEHPTTFAKALTFSKSTIRAPCMSSSVHLCSVMFLCMGLIFSLMTLTCSCINLRWHPVERIFNIFGLYIWNAITAGCCFWSLALWGAMFGNNLRHNIAITDTLRQQLNFSSEGNASLGYSYYLLIVIFLVHIINLVLLFVRRYRLESQPHQMTNNAIGIDTDTEARLEFY